VTVENRAGGDGMVGITAFLSANDDHTLFFGPTATYTAHPYMRATVPYNANDIIPLVRTSVTVVTVAVPTALGVGSLKELVDLAKMQPGKLNWAAVTGLNEYQFMSFVKSAGIDMVRVPYRDLNQAVTDLSEGRIQSYSSAYATARPAVEGGKIKLLALTNTTRAPMLPGIPTSREAGYPALEFDGLVGIHGTPVVQASARARIEKDVLETLKDKTIADRLTATGTLVAPGTAAEFVAAIDTQKSVAAQTAKFLDLKPGQ
jgi:tripartite-type tricarboxylate transporter receptor subunit TctC